MGSNRTLKSVCVAKALTSCISICRILCCRKAPQQGTRELRWLAGSDAVGSNVPAVSI